MLATLIAAKAMTIYCFVEVYLTRQKLLVSLCAQQSFRVVLGIHLVMKLGLVVHRCLCFEASAGQQIAFTTQTSLLIYQNKPPHREYFHVSGITQADISTKSLSPRVFCDLPLPIL